MSRFTVPIPKNEPVRDYAPGSADRAALVRALADLKANPIEVCSIINGKEIKTGKKIDIRCPHNHKQVLGIITDHAGRGQAGGRHRG
jgi:1-pyrroline-5-carboxylate dehydrogenase